MGRRWHRSRHTLLGIDDQIQQDGGRGLPSSSVSLDTYPRVCSRQVEVVNDLMEAQALFAAQQDGWGRVVALLTEGALAEAAGDDAAAAGSFARCEMQARALQEAQARPIYVIRRTLDRS